MTKKPATKKLRVGILFGGRSGEHEVSLLSAASILKAIDRTRYDVIPIGITKQGQWITSNEAQHLLTGNTKPAPVLLKTSKTKSIQLNASADIALQNEPLAQQNGPLAQSLDVIFPVLHGTFGEDGTIQGLFELADIAYVGSGVLGSAAGMDKDAMKRLFAQARLPIVKHLTVLRTAWEASPRKTVTAVEAALRYPLFVKPANLGSSVGISKVHDRKELAPALTLAARFDRKIVIEEGVGGSGKSRSTTKARELEVAVLGNDSPKASVVGEIVPGKEFYDYEAKYLSEGSVAIIPAKLTKKQSQQVQAMALDAFRACDCAGLARVDFLLEAGDSGRLYLNEINTMPGFTSISMYPKLWEASGMKYRDLISRLIELALKRKAEQDGTSYSR